MVLEDSPSFSSNLHWAWPALTHQLTHGPENIAATNNFWNYRTLQTFIRVIFSLIFGLNLRVFDNYVTPMITAIR